VAVRFGQNAANFDDLFDHRLEDDEVEGVSNRLVVVVGQVGLQVIHGPLDVLDFGVFAVVLGVEEAEVEAVNGLDLVLLLDLEVEVNALLHCLLEKLPVDQVGESVEVDPGGLVDPELAVRGVAGQIGRVNI